MRFIKQSEATLAFSKFPFTCMIEIDGIQWDDKENLISLKEYSTKMIRVLKDNNIPFTIHWGKNANWGLPNLVEHMYGDKMKKWKKVRNELLSSQMQDLFSNEFLDITKLSDPLKPDEELIV